MEKEQKIRRMITVNPVIWFAGQDLVTELKRKGKIDKGGMSNYTEEMWAKKLIKEGRIVLKDGKYERTQKA